MSDLGDELRSTIEGAATPVTLQEIAARDGAPERPGRRAPWRTFVAGVAAAALVIVGAIVVVNLGEDKPPATRIAAPTVVVGDIDLAVLSTAFDSDGARGPIAPEVVDAVRAVPGVAGAQGAMQRFVDVVRTDTSTTDPPDRVGAVGDRDLVGRGRTAHVQCRRSSATGRRDRDQPVAGRAVRASAWATSWCSASVRASVAR